MSSKTLNTILYAEDESDIREIAQIALEDLGGFEVIYCTNGFDVLKAAKETEPDLLLLDVMMPGMDGPTALSELRKMPGYVQIPAIFMTAKIQSEEIQHYMAMGALEVISKPFDPMTLADKIKSAWERQA
ncbi:two-component response regulator [Legionella rubrilucens]|uniref:Two-component response regulator n=1 Tax=Legionella rubrilucens TaxID=458 RepID=A0A0W0XQR9_9GAMM|nr:response regulator [Legionella rubrilucens]KTD46949.1 two-component response regulator [Legionella rubrilucens]